MSIFEGAGVALVTPFHEDGSVNYEKLEQIVEEQIAGGTDCIIACGTTGEAATLSHEEHIEVIRFVCQVVNKRIPVVAGTGSNCTETAVYLSTEAKKAGADGLLLVSPYYNKSTQKGLKVHFSEVAKAVDLPILLYNVPSRTGVNITPETIVALCKEYENIVGVKEASGNFSAIAQIASLSGGSVDIYSGNDDQTVPMMALGAKGVISVLSNVAPRQVHDMCAAFKAGDVAKARQMQIDAIPLIEALFCEVNPIPVKEAMNMMIYGTYSGPGTVAKSNASDNALNNFVENELNQWSRKHLKNMDLTFGINTYNQVSEAGESKKTDYSYQFSKRLFNNKVRVKVGGRISTDNDPAAGGVEENLVDDIAIEYVFGKNPNFFLKIFRHTGYESVLEGEVTQTGIGVVLRKNFQKFMDIFRRKKKVQVKPQIEAIENEKSGK